MYLIEDIIGASTKLIYGKKGDQVQVIRQDYEMSFVINKGIKFFIRNEKLSKEKINPTPEIIEQSATSIQRSRKRKR